MFSGMATVEKCASCPWLMNIIEFETFCLYLKSKEEAICYPFEKFCKHCTNTWLKNGILCLEHGHKFKSKDVTMKTCLVFLDGHKSCYHGSKKFRIRGDCLENYNGRVLSKGFLSSGFGQ